LPQEDKQMNINAKIMTNEGGQGVGSDRQAAAP
jgi:hypothetical protein